MDIEVSQLAQRITVLETEATYTKTQLSDINDKLDQLLTLKNKGVGAFWLVGLIFGSGVIGAALTLGSWLLNIFNHR